MAASADFQSRFELFRQGKTKCSETEQEALRILLENLIEAKHLLEDYKDKA